MNQFNEDKNIGTTVEDLKTGQRFTPGPWEARADDVFAPNARANIATASDPYSGRFVGYTKLEINSKHFNEACANARLIAAAPALYEALRLHMQWIGPPPIDSQSFDSLREDAWRKGRAALALVDKPDAESAKRPISALGTNGPAS